VPVYFVCAVFFAAGAAGMYFPRIAIVIVFIVGIIAVWTAIVFMRYPEFDQPGLAKGPAHKERISVESSGGGLLLVTHNKPGAVEGESWNINYDKPLVFEAITLSAHRLFPLVGGEKHGLISKIGSGNEVLFSDSNQIVKPGITSRTFSLELPAGILLPGMELSVIFDGDSLSFEPPLQLAD
jgi:hypothetical protein